MKSRLKPSLVAIDRRNHDALINLHINAADLINHAFKGPEIDHGKILYWHAYQLLYRLYRQPRAPAGQARAFTKHICRVYALVTKTWNFDPQISWDRQHPSLHCDRI